MRRAIFLDKDGTLIRDVPYNVNPERIRLQPYVMECLYTLQEKGFLLFVVSNQPGVALGYFAESELQKVNDRIRLLLNPSLIQVQAFYYCTHHATGVVPEHVKECECRKPMPGLLLTAAREYEIDLNNSWMIGDILDDVEAGNRAGCKTILLNNGHETMWQHDRFRTPNLIVNSLKQAAEIINSIEYEKLAVV